MSLPTSGYTPGGMRYAVSIVNGLSPLSPGFNFAIDLDISLGESVIEDIAAAIEPVLSDLVEAVETATGATGGVIYKVVPGTVDYGDIRSS